MTTRVKKNETEKYNLNINIISLLKFSKLIIIERFINYKLPILYNFID